MLLVIIVSCWIQYSKAHMINFPAAFHFDALSKNLSVLMGQRLFDMWRFVENACRFIVPSNIDSACCIVSEAVSEKVSDQRRLCTSFTEQSVQQLLKHEQTATTFSYTQHLEECTEMSTYYLNLNDKDDWEVIGEEDNIKIWRCNRPFCKFKGAEKWPCVKIRTIIDASPRSLMQLLMDSSRVTLFNKYSEGRTDVQSADDGKSKIVWNRSKHPLQVKPYDFCLFMHGSKVTMTSSSVIYLLMTTCLDAKSRCLLCCQQERCTPRCACPCEIHALRNVCWFEHFEPACFRSKQD